MTGGVDRRSRSIVQRRRRIGGLLALVLAGPVASGCAEADREESLARQADRMGSKACAWLAEQVDAQGRVRLHDAEGFSAEASAAAAKLLAAAPASWVQGLDPAPLLAFAQSEDPDGARGFVRAARRARGEPLEAAPDPGRNFPATSPVGISAVAAWSATFGPGGSTEAEREALLLALGRKLGRQEAWQGMEALAFAHAGRALAGPELAGRPWTGIVLEAARKARRHDGSFAAPGEDRVWTTLGFAGALALARPAL